MPAPANNNSVAAATAVAALNAANNRALFPEAAQQKDGFLALLNIGAEEDLTRPERPARDVRSEDREIVASPVSGDTRVADQPSPLREENHNESPERTGENNSSDRDRADNDNRQASAADAREAGAPAREVRRLEKSKPAEKAKNLGDDMQDDLADKLRERIEALNDLLRMLASLGGNPQAVQVEVQKIMVRVSTVTLTAVRAQDDGMAVTPQQGADRPLVDVLKDMLAQLDDLALSDDALPEEVAGEDKASFFSLLRDMRQLAIQLDGNPQAVEEVARESTPVVQAVRELVRQYSRALDALSEDMSAVRDMQLVARTNVTTEAPKQLNLAAPAQIQQVTPADSLSAPTPVVAAASSNFTAPGARSDMQTGADAQNGGNQGLAQQVGAVRGAGQAQGAQAASGSSFSQLLRQAQETPIDQVMVHIRTASDKSNIKIQLQPEELGRVEIRMQVSADGKTGVSITADNKNTLDLLQRDARGLERALADAGLKADSGSLSFNLRQGQQESGQNQSLAQSYRNPLADETEELLAPVVTRSYVLNVKEGLDVMV